VSGQFWPVCRLPASVHNGRSGATKLTKTRVLPICRASCRRIRHRKSPQFDHATVGTYPPGQDQKTGSAPHHRRSPDRQNRHRIVLFDSSLRVARDVRDGARRGVAESNAWRKLRSKRARRTFSDWLRAGTLLRPMNNGYNYKWRRPFSLKISRTYLGSPSRLRHNSQVSRLSFAVAASPPSIMRYPARPRCQQGVAGVRGFGA
jgi:hypothetical protein